MDTQTIKSKTTSAAEWRHATQHISPMSVGTDASFIIAGLIRDLEAAESKISELQKRAAAMPNDQKLSHRRLVALSAKRN